MRPRSSGLKPVYPLSLRVPDLSQLLLAREAVTETDTVFYNSGSSSSFLSSPLLTATCVTGAYCMCMWRQAEEKKNPNSPPFSGMAETTKHDRIQKQR